MMVVKTKFDQGDRVWVMKDNRPYQFKIHRIEIEVRESQAVHEMYVDHTPGATSLDKDREYFYWDYECFPSKKGLLDSFLTDSDL